MALIQLIYVSAAKKGFSVADLRSMLVRIRPRNEQRGISGILLYKGGSFLQIIEGEESAVNALFAKVGGDKRHEAIALLSRRPIEERNFPEWSMGFALVDERLKTAMPGFYDFFDVGESFLHMTGDATLAHRILEGFRQGQWRQHVES